MRVREDVFVRERGGKLEDIASDLWDDSVSLHWVIYISDSVGSDGITLGAERKETDNKIQMQIPVGTIKVRPVVRIVRSCPPRPPLRSQI